MSFFGTIGFMVGTLSNPITPSGIVAIGVIADKKKISFILGVIWGIGFMVLDIRGLQHSQMNIPYEVYLMPFCYGVLTLFLTWLKILMMKNRSNTKAEPK